MYSSWQTYHSMATGRLARCLLCATVMKLTCFSTGTPTQCPVSNAYLHGHKVQEVVGQHGQADVHTQFKGGIFRVIQ